MNPVSTAIHIQSPRAPANSEESAVILLYHRVADLPSDPQALCVAPSRFAEHLSILTRHFHPLSLRELSRDIANGHIRPRSVAVTFDDGYADNLLVAKPLLEASGVPALVFVAAGYVGGQREFWWDELERILLHTDGFPDELILSIAGVDHCWRTQSEPAANSGAIDGAAGWTVLQKHDPTPQHRIYRALFDVLRPLDDAQRSEVLCRLREQTRNVQTVRPTHRPLGEHELERLAEGGLIEVGAHTMTHPVLAECTPAQQAVEIRQSKAWLEERIGRSVTRFSYPFGTRCDYTAETVALVREAGFQSACSNFEGLVDLHTDSFQWPRVLVRDWDGDTLRRKIQESFRAVR